MVSLVSHIILHARLHIQDVSEFMVTRVVQKEQSFEFLLFQYLRGEVG